jgi:hypothetical protein
MIYEWYEVWADETHDIPYLLLLYLSLSGKDKFFIIDPKENNKVVKILSDYDAATAWLTEDDFTLIQGRMLIDG